MPRGPRTPPAEAKQAAKEFTDEKGEPFTLSIPSIDEVADAHLKAKKKEADGKLKLHEIVLDAYTDLDTEMAKHLDKLPPNRIYTYTSYDNKRKQVQYSKPKITIRNAKAQKKAAVPHEGKGINPK